MAYATCTYTIKPITVMGDKRVHKVLIAVSSYGTDGIHFTPAQAGLNMIDAIFGMVLRTEVANEPVQFVWDEAGELIQCHKTSAVDTDAAVVFDVDVTVMGS